MKIYVTEYKAKTPSHYYYIEFTKEFLGANYTFTLYSFKQIKKLSRKMVLKIMSKESLKNTLRINYNNVTSFRSYHYEYKDRREIK